MVVYITYASGVVARIGDDGPVSDPVALHKLGFPNCRDDDIRSTNKAIQRYRVTTDSRNTRKASPDLVNRIFSTDRPDACWLSDITYIPTSEGWLYLATIPDLHSRAVVGWAMSRTLDCRLAMDALQMAISNRGSAPGILHSDQGTTYPAVDYRALLDRYAIRQSMSRKGNCWDNAPMESFFHTLKTE